MPLAHSSQKGGKEIASSQKSRSLFSFHTNFIALWLHEVTLMHTTVRGERDLVTWVMFTFFWGELFPEFRVGDRPWNLEGWFLSTTKLTKWRRGGKDGSVVTFLLPWSWDWLGVKPAPGLSYSSFRAKGPETTLIYAIWKSPLRMIPSAKIGRAQSTGALPLLVFVIPLHRAYTVANAPGPGNGIGYLAVMVISNLFTLQSKVKCPAIQNIWICMDTFCSRICVFLGIWHERHVEGWTLAVNYLLACEKAEEQICHMPSTCLREITAMGAIEIHR